MSRTASYSILRSLACLAIVVLHTCNYALVATRQNGWPMTDLQGTVSETAVFLQMWAVPLFVMVTGALLLDPARSMDWEKLWKRYLARMLKVIGVFGLLFLVFDLVLNGSADTISGSNFAQSTGAFLSGEPTIWKALLCGAIDLLTGHSWSHMWYLYMLVGLYLLLPFFRKIVANSSSEELRGLLAVLGLFLFVVPLTGLWNLTTDYRFSVATVYPFYLFLGYAMSRGVVNLPKPWWGVLGLLSAASIVLISCRVSNDNLAFFGTSYNSIPVALLAMSVFGLLQNADWPKNKTLAKLLNSFDQCSFGIYLIHFLFVKVAFRYIGIPPFAHWFTIPLSIVAITVLSYGVVWLYKLARSRISGYDEPMKHYYSLSDYCKETYGKKLYKLSLNGGCTCPNRDGLLDTRGCIFCSAGGSGDFAAKGKDLEQQLEEAKARVRGKTDADEYIAYYQSFSGTYPGKNALADGSFGALRERYMETIHRPEIKVLSIATRPDCLGPEVLDMLRELRAIKPVWVELGLQTSNENTATYIRRCYENEVYASAVQTLKAMDIPVVTHLILGLPGETYEDMERSVRYACNCGTWGLKLQLLHVLEGTDLGEQYKADPSSVPIMSMEEYLDLLCQLLPLIPRDVVMHRLTGDGPKRILLAPDWSGNKRRVLNSLQQELRVRQVQQGSAITK